MDDQLLTSTPSGSHSRAPAFPGNFVPFTATKTFRKKIIDLVLEAVESGGVNKKGVSLHSIKKYIEGTRQDALDSGTTTLIRKAIKKGLETGQLKRAKSAKNALGCTGSFLLSQSKDQKKSKKGRISKEQVSDSAAIPKPKKTKKLNLSDTALQDLDIINRRKTKVPKVSPIKARKRAEKENVEPTSNKITSKAVKTNSKKNATDKDVFETKSTKGKLKEAKGMKGGVREVKETRGKETKADKGNMEDKPTKGKSTAKPHKENSEAKTTKGKSAAKPDEEEVEAKTTKGKSEAKSYKGVNEAKTTKGRSAPKSDKGNVETKTTKGKVVGKADDGNEQKTTQENVIPKSEAKALKDKVVIKPVKGKTENKSTKLKFREGKREEKFEDMAAAGIETNTNEADTLLFEQNLDERRDVSDSEFVVKKPNRKSIKSYSSDTEIRLNETTVKRAAFRKGKTTKVTDKDLDTVPKKGKENGKKLYSSNENLKQKDTRNRRHKN